MHASVGLVTSTKTVLENLHYTSLFYHDKQQLPVKQFGNQPMRRQRRRIGTAPGKSVGERGEASQRAVGHVGVLVAQQGRERLDAVGQRLVLGLDFAAEPRDHGHGRVQGVSVHLGPVLADEGEGAREAACLEDRAGFSGAHQL